MFQALTHLLVIAVSIGIVFITYRQSERIESSSLWLVVLLAIATGLVVAAFTGGTAQSLSLGIIAAAQRFVAVFLYLALSDIAHNSRYDSDVVFGLGKGLLYALPVAGGALFANLQDLTFGDSRYSLVVVYVLMLALFLFMRNSAPQGLKLFGDLDPSLPSGQTKQLEQQIDALAASYKLSNREKEIIALYAQGRNRAFISEQLFISENTVRDHIRSIYKKMHIHSKQELISILQRH
jgi:DNA-binding CsgD family transcriptional regulator